MKRVFEIYYNDKKTKRRLMTDTSTMKSMPIKQFTEYLNKAVAKAIKDDGKKWLITWGCKHKLYEGGSDE